MAGEPEASVDEPCVVIQFPNKGTATVSCLNCSYVFLGLRGIFCGMFAEPVVHETVAEECSEFDPIS